MNGVLKSVLMAYGGSLGICRHALEPQVVPENDRGRTGI